MSGPAALDPAQFAALVAGASDEQLATGVATNRELILSEIFRRMPETFVPAAAGDLAAVIEWRIPGRPDGGEDRWQVVVGDGRALVERDGDAAPDVVYTIDAVDFIRLAAGVADGPQLFMFGKLKIDGDLVLATRVPTFFTPPSPPDAALS